MQYILLALILIISNILVWIEYNAQFKFEIFKNPILSVFLIGNIASFICFYVTKWLYEMFNNLLWPGRLIYFAASSITFPILTHFILHESMFTFKTLICTALSVIIVLIQVFA